MMKLVQVVRRLSTEVDGLEFDPPVRFVYNPIAYARKPHESYLERYGASRKEAVFVGMNPGPFGMAQTGLPFGDVVMAREFLSIEGEVGRPPREHPRRPVQGFACPRREVSGTRLWTWARERFGTAEAFFDRFFVLNYCPLVFLEESGRNRTPDKLPAREREALFGICDRALAAQVELLEPSLVIGIGAFAKKRCADALGNQVEVGSILHPSPASPAANRGWAGAAERQLAEMGIEC